MSRLAHELFAFDHGDETVGQKIYFRLLELFIVGYTIKFCWEWAVYTRTIEEVLLPLGVANYLDVSLLFGPLALVNAGTVTLLCVLGVFRWWRPAYLGALLFFHLQYVARYCLGEISHGSNLIGLGLLGLGAAALTFQRPVHRRRFTMGFLVFFIGLGYTSAAFCKLIGTGLAWPDGRHLWMWIAERQVDVTSRLGASDPNALQELILGDVHVGTLVLLFGLLAELCGVLMWVRRFRRPVLLLIAGMHLGIAASMNIFFAASTYLLFLLGLPWAAAIDWTLRHTTLFARRLRSTRFLSV